MQPLFYAAAAAEPQHAQCALPAAQAANQELMMRRFNSGAQGDLSLRVCSDGAMFGLKNAANLAAAQDSRTHPLGLAGFGGGFSERAASFSSKSTEQPGIFSLQLDSLQPPSMPTLPFGMAEHLCKGLLPPVVAHNTGGGSSASNPFQSLQSNILSNLPSDHATTCSSQQPASQARQHCVSSEESSVAIQNLVSSTDSKHVVNDTKMVVGSASGGVTLPFTNTMSSPAHAMGLANVTVRFSLAKKFHCLL
jgi:hypothetical protein